MAIKTKSLCLLVAMQEEASPLVERLGLTEIVAPFAKGIPMRAWSAAEVEGRITLVSFGADPRFEGVSNIGTQPAVLAAHLAIERFAPDLMINAGTAGGFSSRGAEVGQVFLSADRFGYHDRIVPLPGYDESARGNYRGLDVSRIAADLNLKIGRISTGDSLRTLQTDAEEWERTEPALKEMEAAAIAWIAWTRRVPFFAIKAVADLVDTGDTPTEVQFTENLGAAVAALTEVVPRVITYCLGAVVDDLAL